jgi:hypothetical protein
MSFYSHLWKYVLALLLNQRRTLLLLNQCFSLFLCNQHFALLLIKVCPTLLLLNYVLLLPQLLPPSVCLSGYDLDYNNITYSSASAEPLPSSTPSLVTVHGIQTSVSRVLLQVSPKTCTSATVITGGQTVEEPCTLLSIARLVQHFYRF